MMIPPSSNCLIIMHIDWHACPIALTIVREVELNMRSMWQCFLNATRVSQLRILLEMVQLFVESYWLIRYGFEVELDDTVKTLKLEIEEITGQSPESQCLQRLGDSEFASKQLQYPDLQELQDDETFKSYGIQKDDILYLSGKPEESIFVRTLTGKTVHCRIPLDAPVLLLKEKLQDKEGIPPDQQPLVFKSRQLEDHMLLSSYKIQKESTVYLILRLRGGGGGDPRAALAFAVVLYPWSGDMMYPTREGMRLVPGHRLVIIEQVQSNWYLCRIPGGSDSGVVPKNYVRILKCLNRDFGSYIEEGGNESFPPANGQEASEAEDAAAVPDTEAAPNDLANPPTPGCCFGCLKPLSDIFGFAHCGRKQKHSKGDTAAGPNPPLPAFTFDHVQPSLKLLPFAHRGKSHLTVTLTHETSAPPCQPIRVAVNLDCIRFDTRAKVDSVQLTIFCSNVTIQKIEPESPSFSNTVVEPATDTITSGRDREVSSTLSPPPPASFGEVATSWKSHSERTQSRSAPAVETSRRIKGSIRPAPNHAFWSIIEPMTVSSQGIDGEISDILAFTVDGMPHRVSFSLAVHYVNASGVGKSTSFTTRSISSRFQDWATV